MIYTQLPSTAYNVKLLHAVIQPLSSQSSFFLLKRIKKNEDFLARKVVCLLLLALLLEPLCCKLDFVPNLLRCAGPCFINLTKVSF